MTSTRYVNESDYTYILMSDEEWKLFKHNILKSCYFSVKSDLKIVETRYICECNVYSKSIKLRYYSDQNGTNFHMSNDDRRKIVKYLRSIGQL